MKAKTAGILALGAISIGILVGFIVGALSITHPGEFSVARMISAWVFFGVISLGLIVLAGFLKSREIQDEQNKPNEQSNQNDIDIIQNVEAHDSTTPVQHSTESDVVAEVDVVAEADVDVEYDAD